MESDLIYIHDGGESVPGGFKSVQTPGNNHWSLMLYTSVVILAQNKGQPGKKC